MTHTSISNSDLTAHDLSAFLEALPAKSRILDLGCGEGRDLTLLTSAGMVGVGVEISGSRAEVARKQNPGIDILTQNILLLSPKKGEWDAIWANQTFNELGAEEIQRAIGISFQGLRSGGWIGIMMKRGRGSYVEQVGDLGAPARKIYLYEEKPLCSLLEQTGFQILKLGVKSSESLFLVIARRI